jgi:hypothetical protein
MAISEAKLEANRRNSQKSCGPLTEAGKQRSKLNAVEHGTSAATLVLLDEDAQALGDRKAAWTASLLLRGAAEQRIVDDAVEYSWLRDRARRAQQARLATKRPSTYISLIDAAADREKCFAPFELGRARTQRGDFSESAIVWYVLPSSEDAPQRGHHAHRGRTGRAGFAWTGWGRNPGDDIDGAGQFNQADANALVA